MARSRKGRAGKRRATTAKTAKSHAKRGAKRKRQFNGLAAFVITNVGNPRRPRGGSL